MSSGYRIAWAVASAAIVLGAGAGAGAAAEEECCKPPAIRFNYGASFSYAYDFNTPGSAPGNNILTYPSFGQDESFNVDLVQVGMRGERGPVAFSAKLDFGDLALAVGDSADGDIALQEAFVLYDTGPVVLTAGRFPTPFGYEVLEPWGNANISRSRAWTQFVRGSSLDGLTVSGSIGGVDLMAGVVNSALIQDQAIGANDLNDEKTAIASIGLMFGDVSLSLSAAYGEDVETGVENGRDPPDTLYYDAKSDRLYVNAIVAANFEKFRAAVEANVTDNSNQSGLLNPNDNVEDNQDSDDTSWNVTLYLGTTVDVFTFDLRGDYGSYEEVWNDDPNSDYDLWSLTATAGVFLVDGVQFRVEYRHDGADESIFGENSDGETEKHVDVVSAQLVWTPSFQ